MIRVSRSVVVTLQNLQTTSGLSILLFGVIALPDATQCNKFVLWQSHIHSYKVLDMGRCNTQLFVM